MPWPPFNRPSIQLGVLAAFLEQQDRRIQVSCFHPYLAVARAIGPALYQKISRHLWLSEALYATIAYPDHQDESLPLCRRLWRRAGLEERDLGKVLDQLRHQFDRFIGTTDWHDYDLVGFSVCFNQLLASLAAVQRIKALFPDLAVVFGGSALAADMAPALARHGGVDHCICGEGEMPLLQLCRNLLGDPPGDTDTPQQIAHLDRLPIPDYDAYFAELRRVFGEGAFIPVLPVEFSRGCWWRRCTFCNLNRQWHGYRAKSGPRMLAEIRTLANRYRSLDFAFADNALPRRPMQTFFDTLAHGPDYRFFAELRASDADSFDRLARGGLIRIQVGIEALSDRLLERLGKGTTVMDNVYAMKRAVEAGIALEGNLILEFPGTTEEEIQETLDSLDVVMAYPPLDAATFFLGADSPVACHPRRFGIRAIGAHPYLRRLLPFPLPFGVLGYRGDRTIQRRRWRPVRAKLEQWRAAHQRRGTACSLEWRRGEDFGIIRQILPDGTVVHHRLRGASARIYERLATPTNFTDLANAYPRFTTTDLRRFLDELVAKRCIFRHRDTYLALAISTEKRP